MKSVERDIYFFDIEVKAFAKLAKPPTMQELAAVWQAQHDAGKTIKEIRNKTATLVLGDVVSDPKRGVLQLLVRLSDKTLPDAVYSNPVLSRYRPIPKEKEEGGDVAVHVFISLIVGAANTYRAVVERGRGAHFMLVQHYLNWLLREEFQSSPNTFTYAVPSGARGAGGKPNAKPFLPRILFHGHPSETLLAELEGGKITRVSLLKSLEKKPIGGHPYLLQERHEFVMKVVPGTKSKGLLGKVLEMAKPRIKEYATARLYFTRDDGKSEHVDFDIESGSADMDHIKNKRIRNIDPPMAESSEKIVPHFAKAAIEELLRAHKAAPAQNKKP